VNHEVKGNCSIRANHRDRRCVVLLCAYVYGGENPQFIRKLKILIYVIETQMNRKSCFLDNFR
jgi:hypothetical protein